MDWQENDETGYCKAIGDSAIYWVGNDGLKDAPTFGAFVVDGIDTIIYRGHVIDDAIAACEVHNQQWGKK